MEALANWLGQYMDNQDGMMILIFGIIIGGWILANKIQKGDFDE